VRPRRYTIPVRVEPRRGASVETPSIAPREEPHPPDRAAAAPEPDQEDWRDRALRLQAEMENYRKRQRRIAQEQARAGQDRLLVEILSVADNLDRTLDHVQANETAPDPLREGIGLTREELLRLLGQYEVERLDARGEPFDPNWHEAIAVEPANKHGVEPGTVIHVQQAGYRRGTKLLRPAKVVVAQ